MRFICFLVLALALVCVAAAQPSAAPVTLSFSYEQAGYQPAATPQDGSVQHRAVAAAATDDATPRSHRLASPTVTAHPFLPSHNRLFAVNETVTRLTNSTTTVVMPNSTGNGTARMGSEDGAKGQVDRVRNETVVEKRVTERVRETEKGEDERKDGDREASFPDDSPRHNVTHGNRTITNRSQYHTLLKCWDTMPCELLLT